MVRISFGLLAAFILGGHAGMAQAPTSTSTKLEAEVISITDKYIHPPQIKRPVGPFVLIVKNYSRLKGLNIQVGPQPVAVPVGTAAVSVPSLLSAALDLFNGNFDSVINLPAGTYVVTEPNNPLLKCTITLH